MKLCSSDRVMPVAKCAEIQHLDLFKHSCVKRYFCKKRRLWSFIYLFTIKMSVVQFILFHQKKKTVASPPRRVFVFPSSGSDEKPAQNQVHSEPLLLQLAAMAANQIPCPCESGRNFLCKYKWHKPLYPVHLNVGQVTGQISSQSFLLLPLVCIEGSNVSVWKPPWPCPKPHASAPNRV